MEFLSEEKGVPRGLKTKTNQLLSAVGHVSLYSISVPESFPFKGHLYFCGVSQIISQQSVKIEIEALHGRRWNHTESFLFYVNRD